MTYYVRRMQQEDIAQVSEIDREAFPTEWPPPNFKHELHNRIAYYYVVCDLEKEKTRQRSGFLSGKNTGGFISRVNNFFRSLYKNGDLVSANDQYVVGYAGCWVMADEAHITSIASKQTNRHQGIGELLLIAIADLSVKLRASMITLEVRVSNKIAQTLYTKYGFTEVGVRRGYYLDNHEDAILMSTEDVNSDAFQTRFKKLKQAYSAKWGKSRLSDK